jgi:hypothetical protein
MVCFQTKNPNLGKFWRVLLWKILVYFMTIWSILRPSEIFCGHLVITYVVIWYIFPRFGIFDQEKSGNPGGTSIQGDQIRRIGALLTSGFGLKITYRSSANVWATLFNGM